MRKFARTKKTERNRRKGRRRKRKRKKVYEKKRKRKEKYKESRTIGHTTKVATRPNRTKHADLLHTIRHEDLHFEHLVEASRRKAIVASVAQCRILSSNHELAIASSIFTTVPISSTTRVHLCFVNKTKKKT